LEVDVKPNCLLLGPLLFLAFSSAAMAWQTGVCTVINECRSDTSPCSSPIGKSVVLRLLDDGASAQLRTAEYKTALTLTSSDENRLEFAGSAEGNAIEVALNRLGNLSISWKSDDGVQFSTLAQCRKVAG
jgi:hypothetical protein